MKIKHVVQCKYVNLSIFNSHNVQCEENRKSLSGAIKNWVQIYVYAQSHAVNVEHNVSGK